MFTRSVPSDRKYMCDVLYCTVSPAVCKFCCIAGETGLSARSGAVSQYKPAAVKILPAYTEVSSKPLLAPDQGLTMAGFSFGQQVRNIGAQQPLSPPHLTAKGFAPLPMTSAGADLLTAVNNLAKLAEPSAGGDVVDRNEPTKADSGDKVQQAPSGLPGSEAVRVESTSAGISTGQSASAAMMATAVEVSATPDMVSPSLAASQHGQKPAGASDQTALSSVLPTPESTTPLQSGIAVSGMPSVPNSSAPASGSFVSGKSSFTDTSSKLFGPPLSAADTRTAEQQIVTTSSGSSAVITASSGEDVSASATASAAQTLPVTPTSSAESTVLVASSVQTTMTTSAVDTVAQPVASPSTPATFFGHSVISSTTITSSTGPDVVFGQPSTTAAASTGVSSAPVTTSTTISGQPPSSSVAATSTAPATVFGQPPAAAPTSMAGTAVFGGPTSTSVTTSATSVFGIPSASTGLPLFGQQPSSTSGSSVFGQQTTTPSSAVAASSSINIFGQPSATASASGIFGVFGQPSSSVANTSGFKPFGFAASSSSAFGQTPSFGQSTFGQSAFGQTSSR